MCVINNLLQIHDYWFLSSWNVQVVYESREIGWSWFLVDIRLNLFMVLINDLYNFRAKISTNEEVVTWYVLCLLILL